MKNLRLIDAIECIVVGNVIVTRKELVDMWNEDNPDKPTKYEIILAAKEIQIEN